MKLRKNGGDYSYAYGVVSGKGSKLFTKKQIEDLAMFRSVGEVTAFLEGTEYEKDIQEAVGKKVDPEKLERCIISHFTRIYKEISSFLPEADKDTLEKIIMGNIEVENLMIMMRLIRAGKDSDEIEKTVFLRDNLEIDKDVIEKLLSSKTVDEFVSNLENTAYHEFLNKAIDDYKEEDSIIPLEDALRKYLIHSWLSLEDKISDDLKSYIGKRIDIMNINYIMRTLSSGKELSVDKLYPGRHFTSDIIKSFDGIAGIEDALNILDKTAFGDDSREGYKAYEKTKSFVKLENLLYSRILKRFADDSLFNPPSMSSVILFLERKNVEIKNLRRIIVCKANELPSDDIKEILI